MTAFLRARRRIVALTALAALAWSAPALAQTQLYLLTAAGEVEVAIPITDPNCQPWDYGCELTYIRVPARGRVIHLDVDQRRIAATTPISRALGEVIGPHPTPDGRFLMWTGSSATALPPFEVSLFDIARRQQAMPFAVDYLSAVPLTVHPSEMRAFMQLTSGGSVTVAEPGHTHTLPPPCAAARLENRSGDGSRLSYYCPEPRSVRVVDGGNGRLLGTVALGAPAYPSVSTTHLLDGPGTTLYAIDVDHAFEGDLTRYRRFDVDTGTLLAERRGLGLSFDFGISLWAYSQMTGHLYAGNWSDIFVLDANTLAEIGRIASPFPAQSPKLAFDPDQPHAFVAWPRAGGGAVRVSLVHTGTLATLGSADIPIDGDLVGLVLGPRPPRMSALNILVVDRTATLTWTSDTSRSMATEQVVEVGFAPGETVAQLPVAADATSVTVTGVPPGRYYVRVRSINGTGVGAPSNEVIVDMP